MPPCDQTGTPGDVGLTHFHSSTISGSAAWTISRTFASVLPRQSPSSLIFASIDAEADCTGAPAEPGFDFLGWLTGVFMCSSNVPAILDAPEHNLQLERGWPIRARFWLEWDRSLVAH